MRIPWPCFSKKAPGIRSGPERCRRPQWFTPEDGLITICTLHDFLREAPVALGADTAAVVAEFEEYERVLRKTAVRNLRWQLAVSWK
jgi:hypothetical protein